MVALWMKQSSIHHGTQRKGLFFRKMKTIALTKQGQGAKVYPSATQDITKILSLIQNIRQ